MEAFWISTGLVAIAEIGDKTQLLSLMLAARYRSWLPISLGIFVATLANHALAGALGVWVAGLLGPTVLRWLLAGSFAVMAVWMLIPDRLDREIAPSSALGVFGITTIAFFVAEIGDKTQLATVALAARFDSFAPVVVGTTLGMLIANVPVVVFGEALTRLMPLTWIRRVAALLCAVLALVIGFGVTG